MSIARSLITIIAGLSMVTLAMACGDAPPTSTPPLRLTLDHPAELETTGGSDYSFGLALAPDGRRLVFPAHQSGQDGLWLRDLRSGAISFLATTEDGVLPFWSPDGTAIGFFAGGKLRALTLTDGTVRDLADAPVPRGGAWHPNGDIVFAPNATGGLVRLVAASTPQPLTTLEGGESSHRLPRFLGDTHILYFVRATEPTRQGIWIAPLSAPSSRKRLVNSDAGGLALDSTLIYASGAALVAQRIDLETMSLTGKSVLLGSPVGRGGEHQLFAAAAGDLLVFGLPASRLRHLRWVDRAGNVNGTLGEPMDAFEVRVAPLGARVAVARVDPQLNTVDIWAYDGQRPLPRRLSPAIDADDSPAWSRDGARVAWTSGRRAIIVRDSRADRPEQIIRKFENAIRVADWSPDGRWLIVNESRPGTGWDLVLVAPTPDASPRAYAYTSFNETHGMVSPNGRWLAYASDESGRNDVYVDVFPTAGRRARLSVGGGAEPRWSRDGTAVFFRRGSELHMVRVAEGGGTLHATSSERLFDAGAEVRSFDVSPDGQRFLLNVPVSDAGPRAMTVLVNVRSLLPSAP